MGIKRTAASSSSLLVARSELAADLRIIVLNLLSPASQLYPPIQIESYSPKVRSQVLSN
jgi:hypothetical protein